MTGPRGQRLLVAALRLLPAHRRDLGHALVAELASLPAGRRTAWVAGGLWFVLKESVMRPLAYALGLSAGVLALLWVDRSTSEVANQAALLVLLVASAAIGFAVPRLAWLGAAVIGSAIAMAHVVYATLGPALPYAAEPPGVGGALTLLVLAVPAFAAAYAGAGARWLLLRRTR